MLDWKGHAARGNWEVLRELSNDLPDGDRLELLDVLRSVVPARERGHGIETYKGFIKPWEAESAEVQSAAHLANFLELQKRMFFRRSIDHCPQKDAIELAISTINANGIRFEGYRATYVYWHSEKRQWVQLKSKIGSAICKKKIEIMTGGDVESITSLDEVTAELESWRSMYPWRACHSLHTHFRCDAFEQFTPIWHALNILDWQEMYRTARGRLERLIPDVRDEAFDLSTISRAAFEIGRCYEALLKKPFEPHALRGISTLEAAGKAGEARRGTFASQTQLVLDEMDRLIERGHSKSRAAELSVKRGIGTSKAANYALWYRHKKS